MTCLENLPDTFSRLVTIDGRDYYLGPYDSPEPREKCDRLIREWLAGGRSLRIGRQDRPTVAELVREYWAWVKSYYFKNDRPTSELVTIRAALKILLELHRRTALSASLD